MNIAFIGNYIPRNCGIATFTADLATWVDRNLGEGSDVFVVAMNDRPEGYDYPSMVRFEVLANMPRDYHRAADFVNLSGVDVVCLQHEFGIFGGPFGVMITGLLKDLRKPVVTTVHTVLPDPEPERRHALAQVAALSDALVVMSRKSIEFLETYYGIKTDKVHLIHHGVPDRPPADPDEHKARWGLEGRTVILNFGLLTQRKGVEYMIQAMPRIVARFPDVTLVILGATHPATKKREGEKYRFYLKRLARELGVEGNVEFYDRFVTLDELTDFLAASDIYVTPYVERGQLVSGTLAYAVGLGKPVVSTSYYYAEELLGDGRGVLVDFRDPEGLARGVLGLLEDPEERRRIREAAYAFGRRMIWEEVAKEYTGLFKRALAGRGVGVPARAPERRQISIRDLPRPKLDHLARFTDGTGVLRKAHFDIPDRGGGYTTEDNALALAAAVLTHLQMDDPQSLELARTCISFLSYMQRPDGRFHNLLNYDRSFGDEQGGEECQGKALLGLGMAVALLSEEGPVSLAKKMFDEALEAVRLAYPRALAYAVCGCYHYLTRFPGASYVLESLERMARALMRAYHGQASDDWRWFEDTLYYANGLLPRALLLAYRTSGDERFCEVGLESLEFLTDVCYHDGMFDLVGDQGWFPRGGRKARFRQLPVEASSLNAAYIDAYMVERNYRYLELARHAFEWFLGRNVAGEPLYDFASSSCSDGIVLRGVDTDRSADATIHWLLTLMRTQFALNIEPSPEGADMARSG